MTYLEFGACIFLIWILIYSIFFETKYYKEYEVAQIAYDEENVTHLLTNEGKLYRSTNSKHVVIVFTRKDKPDKIKTIWIKRFPCAHCSQILSNFFRYYNKPRLYIGRIYRPYNDNDREGLKNLIREGFEMEVWKSLHDKTYSIDNTELYEYIEAMKQETIKQRWCTVL